MSMQKKYNIIPQGMGTLYTAQGMNSHLSDLGLEALDYPLRQTLEPV